MALVRIGRMDRRITINRRVVTRGAAGGVTETWEQLAIVWAEKLDIRGREFIASQQVNSEITTQFRIRYRSDVRPEMRIVYAGRDYDIVQVSELGRRRWLEIVASAVDGEEIDFESEGSSP